MIFASLFDVFRGKAVTIPPMDGALRPNTALDDSASEILEVSEPDNLCGSAEHVFYSSGHDVMRLEGLEKDQHFSIAAKSIGRK